MEGDAIRTFTASVAEPGDANALADPKSFDAISKHIDSTDNFVTGDNRDLGVWQFSIHDVKVSSANAAGKNLHPDLPGSGLVVGELGPLKRSLKLLQDHCVHGFLRSCLIGGPERRRRMVGMMSGRSSAISPNPNSLAHSPWIHTPAAAARNGSIP